MNEYVYVVVVWHGSVFDESDPYDEIYGIYSTAEKAKEAAEASEEKWKENSYCYSIMEYELDADNGEIRGL